jgi:hypothetical protein
MNVARFPRCVAFSRPPFPRPFFNKDYVNSRSPTCIQGCVRVSCEGKRRHFGRYKKEFKIDSSGLWPEKNAPLPLRKDNMGHNDNDTGAVQKEALTSLGKEIKQYIQMRGAISIFEYMNLCINHSSLGYYHQVWTSRYFCEFTFY